MNKKRPSVLSEARPSFALGVFKTLHEADSSGTRGAIGAALESERRTQGHCGAGIARELLPHVVGGLLFGTHRHQSHLQALPERSP